jgi:hypothetical protein
MDQFGNVGFGIGTGRHPAKPWHCFDQDFLSFTVKSYTAGRTGFTYVGELTGTPNGDAPNILAKSYTIAADVEVPSAQRSAQRPARHDGLLGSM